MTVRWPTEGPGNDPERPQAPLYGPGMGPRLPGDPPEIPARRSAFCDHGIPMRECTCLDAAREAFGEPLRITHPVGLEPDPDKIDGGARALGWALLGALVVAAAGVSWAGWWLFTLAMEARR